VLLRVSRKLADRAPAFDHSGQPLNAFKMLFYSSREKKMSRFNINPLFKTAVTVHSTVKYVIIAADAERVNRANGMGS
jgi:hypothetical protein